MSWSFDSVFLFCSPSSKSPGHSASIRTSWWPCPARLQPGLHRIPQLCQRSWFLHCTLLSGRQTLSLQGVSLPLVGRKERNSWYRPTIINKPTICKPAAQPHDQDLEPSSTQEATFHCREVRHVAGCVYCEETSLAQAESARMNLWHALHSTCSYKWGLPIHLYRTPTPVFILFLRLHFSAAWCRWLVLLNIIITRQYELSSSDWFRRNLRVSTESRQLNVLLRIKGLKYIHNRTVVWWWRRRPVLSNGLVVGKFWRSDNYSKY